MFSEDIDFEEDLEEGSSVSNEALQEVSRLAEEQAKLEREVAECEEALKERKKQLAFMNEVRLPEAMDNVGLKNFTLHSGEQITIEPVTKASIPAKYRDEAVEWLRRNGFGALVKRKLALSFGKGQDEVADQVLQYLQEQMNLSAEDKPEVHHQTLTAFVKEQQAKGVALPEDILGIYNTRRAKIKRTA